MSVSTATRAFVDDDTAVESAPFTSSTTPSPDPRKPEGPYRIAARAFVVRGVDAPRWH